MEAIARVKKAKVRLCTPRQVLGGRKGCQGGSKSGDCNMHAEAAYSYEVPQYPFVCRLLHMP